MNNFTIVLDVSSSKTLYEQLYQYIKNEIKSGNLTENEKLPSKKALSAHLHISQNTVETAYSMLVQEGFVNAKPKSGFY
ncbi:MAG: GntR family transcriptional regulator, partial [Clostridia bacterium]|nr:GntR family transcriptional regulator [Clostridia bacterium]